MKPLYKLITSSCFGLALFTSSAFASELELGLYGLASTISGDVSFKGVSTDVDVSFRDILSHLDMGLMGFAEYNYGKITFLVDLFYVKLSADKSKSFNSFLTTSLEAEVKQTMAEAFVGYELYAKECFSLDLLGGVRYNSIDVSLGVEANIFSTTLGTVRSTDNDWLDAVIGARGIYKIGSSWALTGWADYGKGSDSHSYQLAAFLSRIFENNFKIFAGYRSYSFNYKNNDNQNNLNLDLDYRGPMLGFSYRLA